MLPFDKMPYTNFHELNLAYFIVHFREIFAEWETLYNNMVEWREQTDADLTLWKTDTLNAIEDYERDLTDAWDTWKSETALDIADWKDETLEALDAWKTAFQTLFDSTFSNLTQIKTDAEAARDAAIAAQNRAEAAAQTLVLDPTLTSATQAAQAKAVGNAIEDLKDSLSEKANTVSITGQLIKGKKSKTVNSTIAFLSEKDPVNIVSDFSRQRVIIHGRNRFDLENAVFTFSGYTSAQTLTKDADGITIHCNVSNTSAYLYAYTTYTAEFDGNLFVSCEADTIGNIADVCALVQVNGTSQTRLYGRGFLYEKITVAKGDDVRLMFYTHMGTNAYNTVTYKNIQIAYEGLYEYMPYREDVINANPVERTLALPVDSSAYVLATTADSSYKWVKLKEEYNTIPSRLRPVNNDIVASIVVTGLPLVTYNQTYNMTIGVGLSSSGTLGIYNNQNRTEFIAWLSENPVTITYTDYEGFGNLADYTFTQGEIIELETAQNITYYYTDNNTGKTVLCFGDSITGMFGNDCGYPSMLKYFHNINGINAGFAGCRWTDHTNTNYLPFSMNRLVEAIVSNDFTLQEASPLVTTGASNYNPLFAEHLQNIKNANWYNVDYVTMFWGTNDWGENAILESSDDPSTENKQRTNVEDAIKYSINQLVTKYPHLKVIVITPYWRAITTGKDSNVDPNTNNEYLYDWALFMDEVASTNYNIPVLALYRTLGANVLTNRYFTQDGTHPTEMTKRIIADRIALTLSIY